MKNVFFKDIQQKFELKDGTGDDSNFIFIKGLGSTFGNVDSVGDIVEKGAFVSSLMKKMPKLLLQHRSADVIGVWDKAYETELGLALEGRLFKDNTLVKNAYPALKEGGIDSMSIGFNTVEADYDAKTGIRTLKEVDLWEVSLVTFPANDKAKIMSVKSLNGDDKINAEDAEGILTKQDFERVLKDCGAFTNKAAKILASRFKETQCDADNTQRDVVQAAMLKEIEQIKQGFSNVKR